MENVNIFFSIWNYSEHLEQFFNFIIRMFSCLLQCKIPVYFYFWLCIETSSGRTGFLKKHIIFFYSNDITYIFSPFVSCLQDNISQTEESFFLYNRSEISSLMTPFCDLKSPVKNNISI